MAIPPWQAAIREKLASMYSRISDLNQEELTSFVSDLDDNAGIVYQDQKLKKLTLFTQSMAWIIHVNRVWSPEVPEDLLDEFPLLEQLYIDSPALEKIPKDFFINLPNLKKLVIICPKLTSVHAELFRGLVNLESLVLVTSLDRYADGILEGLDSLRYLSLGKNLRSLPSSIISLKLYQLDIRNNPLTDYKGKIEPKIYYNKI